MVLTSAVWRYLPRLHLTVVTDWPEWGRFGQPRVRQGHRWPRPVSPSLVGSGRSGLKPRGYCSSHDDRSEQRSTWIQSPNLKKQGFRNIQKKIIISNQIYFHIPILDTVFWGLTIGNSYIHWICPIKLGWTYKWWMKICVISMSRFMSTVVSY